MDYDMEKRFAQIKKLEEAGMRKYGFYIHYILPTTQDEVGVGNGHTHGVQESFGHMDFQIKLHIPHETAGWVFHMLVDKIKLGERFVAEEKYYGLLSDPKLPLLFVEKVEEDRMVLRVLFPDPNGYLPDDPECDRAYANQRYN